jgi:hypothetical protein
MTRHNESGKKRKMETSCYGPEIVSEMTTQSYDLSMRLPEGSIVVQLFVRLKIMLVL